MRAEDLAALLPTAASNASRPLATVFLDSDGTLREFEDKPEDAVPTEEIQRLLAGLSGLSGLNVWIVSGRCKAASKSCQAKTQSALSTMCRTTVCMLCALNYCTLPDARAHSQSE